MRHADCPALTATGAAFFVAATFCFAMCSGASAQSTSRPLLPNLLLPAEPSRPDSDLVPVRRITLVQLDAEGRPLGTPLVLTCPGAVCQDTMTLVVDDRQERFAVAITIVARGTYVNLEARTLGTAKIVEFGTGRTSPAFVASRGREIVSRDLRYVISRDASARSVNRGPGATPDPNTLADGYVFTRKRESDVVLRMEVQIQVP